MIVSIDVHYGGDFRELMKEYKWGKTISFEDIDIRDFGLQDLQSFLKEKVPCEFTAVYFKKDECDVDCKASLLCKDDQWKFIKDTIEDRLFVISLYVVLEDEETLGYRYIDEAAELAAEAARNIPSSQEYISDGHMTGELYFADD